VYRSTWCNIPEHYIHPALVSRPSYVSEKKNGHKLKKKEKINKNISKQQEKRFKYKKFNQRALLTYLLHGAESFLRS
jgi:hypothetical protein